MENSTASLSRIQNEEEHLMTLQETLGGLEKSWWLSGIPSSAFSGACRWIMWQLRTCDVNTVDCIPEVAMVFSAFIRKALFSTWNSQWLVSSTTILSAMDDLYRCLCDPPPTWEPVREPSKRSASYVMGQAEARYPTIRDVLLKMALPWRLSCSLCVLLSFAALELLGDYSEASRLQVIAQQYINHHEEAEAGECDFLQLLRCLCSMIGGCALLMRVSSAGTSSSASQVQDAISTIEEKCSWLDQFQDTLIVPSLLLVRYSLLGRICVLRGFRLLDRRLQFDELAVQLDKQIQCGQDTRKFFIDNVKRMYQEYCHQQALHVERGRGGRFGKQQESRLFDLVKQAASEAGLACDSISIVRLMREVHVAPSGSSVPLASGALTSKSNHEELDDLDESGRRALQLLFQALQTSNIGSASYLLSQSNKFATESVGCRPQSESSLLVAGVVTMHYGLSLFHAGRKNDAKRAWHDSHQWLETVAQAHPDNHDALQALTDVLFKAACCEEDLVTALDLFSRCLDYNVEFRSTFSLSGGWTDEFLSEQHWKEGVCLMVLGWHSRDISVDQRVSLLRAACTKFEDSLEARPSNLLALLYSVQNYYLLGRYSSGGDISVQEYLKCIEKSAKFAEHDFGVPRIAFWAGLALCEIVRNSGKDLDPDIALGAFRLVHCGLKHLTRWHMQQSTQSEASYNPLQAVLHDASRDATVRVSQDVDRVPSLARSRKSSFLASDAESLLALTAGFRPSSVSMTDGTEATSADAVMSLGSQPLPLDLDQHFMSDAEDSTVTLSHFQSHIDILEPDVWVLAAAASLACSVGMGSKDPMVAKCGLLLARKVLSFAKTVSSEWDEGPELAEDQSNGEFSRMGAEGRKTRGKSLFGRTLGPKSLATSSMLDKEMELESAEKEAIKRIQENPLFFRFVVEEVEADTAVRAQLDHDSLDLVFLAERVIESFGASYMAGEQSSTGALALAAARTNDLEYIQQLLEDNLLDIRYVSPVGSTLLECALLGKHEDLCLWLLDNGADDRHFNEYLGTSVSALALSLNCLQVVRKLYSRGVSFSEAQPNGMVPFHEVASAAGVDLILSFGYDFSQTNSYQANALHVTCQLQRESAAVRLLKRQLVSGVDSVDGSGYTACHYSSREGLLRVLHLLVQLGVDVNARTLDGLTPLHLAVERSHSLCAQFLVTAGANPDAVDSFGTTAREKAALRGIELFRYRVPDAMRSSATSHHGLLRKFGRKPKLLECTLQGGMLYMCHAHIPTQSDQGMLHSVAHQELPLHTIREVHATPTCPSTHSKFVALWSGHGIRVVCQGRPNDLFLCAPSAEEARQWCSILSQDLAPR